ncbi:MAG: ABC transporter permease [Sphingopyxis sp.]|nr:ABC transporter permease [Sphingopyxis sp.]
MSRAGGSLTRLIAVMMKELRVVLRDKKARTTLIFSPVVQLLLFGLATTLEVRNVDIGIVTRDNGAATQAFVAAVDASPWFDEVKRYPNADALRDAIDVQAVMGGVLINDGIDDRIARSDGAELLVLLDGRRANAAQIVAGYLDEIARQQGARLTATAGTTALVAVATTHWFNPNLIYLWFTMPSLIVVIGAVQVMSVSCQSVAREREFGTIEQLIVLPLASWQVLIGKLTPAFVVGMATATFFVIFIPLVYAVPLTGSMGLLYLSLMLYFLALGAMGVAISVLARNQQQAFLGMFLATIPIILLSGYASPVDNMPGWLQSVAWANPASHILAVVEGLFLKAMPASAVWAELRPVALVAAAAGALAWGLIHRRLRQSG